uniref:Transcription factor kayak, isoforms D/sro n=1 Tax=Drosophila melanogaster TaxID=7227 RepID=FOSLD_DROME|nr:kayak, isoform D [Drosophila melanogaster]A8MPH9.2 RecName: Full=Transcription factor kayak, isoforms D/sro; AltName: Full=AP-1; AltName: Full=Fos-related antigen; Short=Dfos; Short=dFra [Drosophila melanogaster]AAZ83991.1 kayak, isoform D [Drosophila melanogaster]|eukprot:NP_001027580.1 kayak, isoform D [Drosophila melanogaster]
MIALKATEMQHNNNALQQQQQLQHQLLQQHQQQHQQQLQQQLNSPDNNYIWATTHNANISRNNAMLQLQQQQLRAPWITDCNKQHHINNNNSMNVNYNQQLTQQPQQQQQQTQYMQHNYNNYTQQQQQQHLVPATTSQSNSHFYQCNQQQQQQQFLAPTTTTAAVVVAAAHQQHQTQQQHQSQQQQQHQRQDYASLQMGRQLGNFETGQSVLTLTTPTLTPTTTRNIEDTLGHLLSDTQTDRVAGCAGFAVPKVLPNAIDVLGMGIPTGVSSLPLQQTFDLSLGQGSESEDSNASYNDTQMNEEQDTTDTSSAHTDSTSYQAGHIMAGSVNGGGVNNFSNVLAAVSSSRGSASVGSSNANTSNTPARRGGGRRPNRSTNMTPEEEQKRAVRRERNKQAAARCRKRRVDQTNELTEEVEQLEKRGESMRKEIEVLTNSKNQLEYLLATHRATCQKIRSDMLSVVTCNGLIAPAGLLSAGSSGSGASSHHNHNSNDSSNGTITGMDATLNSTGRSNSPLDLKPAANIDSLLMHIKDEPLDGAIDSGSSLDQDGPPPSKRITLPPMSTMPHVHLSTILTPTGASSGSLQTPITSTAPGGFGSAFPVTSNGSSINNINSIGNNMNSPTLNAHNKVPKERPNTLAFQRPLGQMHLTMANNKAGGPTQIQGVPIQTPSTGTFNFDSLMDGGTGLTPVSGPLVPNSSSTNKHPLELPTPTAEPSKLVSL